MIPVRQRRITMTDVAAECRHDMRPSVQFSSEMMSPHTGWAYFSRRLRRPVRYPQVSTCAARYAAISWGFWRPVTSTFHLWPFTFDLDLLNWYPLLLPCGASTRFFSTPFVFELGAFARQTDGRTDGRARRVMRLTGRPHNEAVSYSWQAWAIDNAYTRCTLTPWNTRCNNCTALGIERID